MMTRDHADEDDAVPVAADIAPADARARPPPHRGTRAARIFGGVVAFLSLWQALSPDKPGDTLLGLGGFVVSALYFVPVRKLVRLLATIGFALAVWLLR